MSNINWFKQAKCGMMIHFGLYSLLMGEYKGKNMGKENAEWAQAYFAIEKKEYEKLCSAFNPIYFSASEWVKLAKDAGMKYIVITSKHHDGFALFKSSADKFNVYDMTPFKRDIIKELSEECRKQDIKFGIYYSQSLDWHENDKPFEKYRITLENGKEVDPWDIPHPGDDYHSSFIKKIKPQVKELLTNYGEISLIWFDMPHTISKEESKELYDLVKKYQPNCLINSRIGVSGVKCDYQSLKDNEIPTNKKEDMFYETPVSLNTSWGYKWYDQNYKNAEEIYKIKKICNENNVNLLLNVSPDLLGRIPSKQIDILMKVKEMMDNDN